MNVYAHLTVGWEQALTPRALTLDQKAWDQAHVQDRLDKEVYRKELIAGIGAAPAVFGVDELFHRRVSGGFDPIKRFLGALVSDPSSRDLMCHIDVFAYAFLKNAKNMDLSLPESAKGSADFRGNCEVPWQETLSQLERFERLGDPIEPKTRTHYLALRKIALRKSARDEWRAMASLIFSGPASMEEISAELGLNYTLGPRLLKPFIDCEAVQVNLATQQYMIEEASIPFVLYFLRELLGLDPLGGL